ncbi:helix-turn-helix domain-containing protein [Halococcus thailandensis]|uniref:Bacterio-opsin activator HTH domain protein n=1 Tax=Halococcus thailandensis JCM 13552 TaxID=1227457 RepID=M0N8Y4_9EURY|nr:helix-turn-helix domain-containing protein [Halococcus thailandensis]EMA54013.1 Bacterio-opsin activator HTH domain protein [Halococcus thailandensis JCM 13552]
MRYVTFVLIPPDGGLHPSDRRLAEESDVTRTALHDINRLDDGTAVTLYRLDGTVERIETILDDCADVLAHNVSATGDSVHAYVHFETNDVVAGLLAVPHAHGIILDTPIEFTPRGGLRITVVGEETTIRETIGTVPDGIGLKLEETGEYEPSAQRLFARLTTRQQETLKAAIEAGYYEVPRRATHADIAERLDRTGGTVGEHLRKIEAAVLTAIVP